MATRDDPFLRPLLFRAARALKSAEYWLIARFALGALWLLRQLPPDRALDFADRTARRLGPWLGRHRTALDNLRRAYPEKPQAEIDRIASDMWGNMARLATEYVFLDQLFQYDPQASEPGRVEIEGAELFEKLRNEDRPHIFFTAHIGNFEMLPVAAAAFGLPLTVLFRAPNNPYIAKSVFSTRAGLMGELLASRAGAAFALARVLEAGGNIGALVDQKFRRGVKTTFFGRPCETSPLVGKLARQYKCDVYPAHTIRLPGNRYRIILRDRIELPRTAAGEIDPKKTTQLLTDIVEQWVREDPGQWMWFHKRWQID